MTRSIAMATVTTDSTSRGYMAKPPFRNRSIMFSSAKRSVASVAGGAHLPEVRDPPLRAGAHARLLLQNTFRVGVVACRALDHPVFSDRDRHFVARLVLSFPLRHLGRKRQVVVDVGVRARRVTAAANDRLVSHHLPVGCARPA